MKRVKFASAFIGLILLFAQFGFSFQWVPTYGPPFGGAVDIAVSGNLVFAADNNYKLYRSNDGGENWIVSGGLLTPISNPTAVIFTSGNNVANVGFWGGTGTKRSTDQGVTWNNPGTCVTNTQVTCLAAAPSDPTRVYAGCYPYSTFPVVFRSDNAGVDWTSASPGNMAFIEDLGVGPRHPALVVATANGGTQNHGIWRTTNGGANWSQIYSANDMFCVAFNPLNTQSATVYFGGVPGVLKSTDTGLTWFTLSFPGGQVNDLVVDPQDTLKVYAITNGNGVYRSTNGGASWTPINGSGSEKILFPFGRALAIDAGSLYAGIRTAFYKSTDGGAHWLEKNKGMKPFTAFSLDVLGATQYVTHSSGAAPTQSGLVSKSTDWGASWLSTYLPNPWIQNVYSDQLDPVVVDRTNGNHAYAYFSTQNALYSPNFDYLYRTTDGGLTWSSCWQAPDVTAEVTDLVINPSDGNEVWAPRNWDGSLPNQQLMRTSDGGTNWTMIGNPNLPGATVHSVALKPNQPLEAYAGVQGIYRTTDNGTSWTTRGLTSGSPTCIQHDPLTPATAYAGLVNDGIRRTFDDGSTWLTMNAGLTHQNVDALCLDPIEPAILWTASEDAGIGHVYVSVDHALQWTEVSTGLPTGGHVHDLKTDVNRPDTVWAATSTDGIYKCGMVFQFKPLTSANSEASDFNSQRKLVRQEWTNTLHAVYHSGGSGGTTFTTPSPQTAVAPGLPRSSSARASIRL